MQQPHVGGGDDGRCVNSIAKPRNLWGNEVGVEFESGDLCESLAPTIGTHLLAQRCAAAVLPHDAVAERFAGVAIPSQNGLALVGKPDCIGDVSACELESGPACGEHALPQQLGINLNAAIGCSGGRARRFGFGNDVAVRHHNCFRGRRALVDRENAHELHRNHRAGFRIHAAAFLGRKCVATGAASAGACRCWCEAVASR